MVRGKIITKSRYIIGRQCKRLLWVSVNSKERLPEIDPVTQHTFDTGSDVGRLAQQLFPDGITLEDNFMENIKATRAALSLRRPIFEAGFMADRTYCRVDILVPSGDDGWDIIEVKSSTEVKEVHLQDLSFQRMVCRSAGLNIDRCVVVHIDNSYIRRGELDLCRLFTREDVTDLLDACSAGLDEYVEELLACIDSPDCPDGLIGGACDDPYPCALKHECWGFLPEQNVMTLSRGRKLAEKLLAEGILDIRDIPPEIRLNSKQCIQRDCALTGKAHWVPDDIRAFLIQLSYPLYFMDFETFQTAVPLFDESSPYQQIPFQFSLHIVRQPELPPEHYAYLHDGSDDPRPRFLEELGRIIGSDGTILAYFKSFEEARLKEAASVFPAHREWIENVLARMLDLYQPFNGFSYYHPSQYGSASLKYVMPALTGISYQGLAIREGGTASLKFMEANFTSDINPEARAVIRRDLLEYCGQDTGGMVAMLDRLRELTGE